MIMTRPGAALADLEKQIYIPAASRGHAHTDWLDSYHSFSFGDYFDPARMGFGNLRVINDDAIAGGGGFPTHPHRDMEIVTLVFDGTLAHRDSLGNSSEIKAGEVQRMTAGTGIRHSEFNASPTQPVHLYQIWILPEARDLAPSYEQKMFSRTDTLNAWKLVGSRDGRMDSVSYHQDLDIYRASLESGKTLDLHVPRTRMLWLQIASGTVSFGTQKLQKGDAFAIAGEALELSLLGRENTELILFDQPVPA